MSKDWVEEQLGPGRFQNLLSGNYLQFEGGEEPVNPYSALWIIQEQE